MQKQSPHNPLCSLLFMCRQSPHWVQPRKRMRRQLRCRRVGPIKTAVSLEFSMVAPAHALHARRPLRLMLTCLGLAGI